MLIAARGDATRSCFHSGTRSNHSGTLGGQAPYALTCKQDGKKAQTVLEEKEWEREREKEGATPLFLFDVCDGVSVKLNARFAAGRDLPYLILCACVCASGFQLVPPERVGHGSRETAVGERHPRQLSRAP